MFMGFTIVVGVNLCISFEVRYIMFGLLGVIIMVLIVDVVMLLRGRFWVIFVYVFFLLFD